MDILRKTIYYGDLIIHTVANNAVIFCILFIGLCVLCAYINIYIHTRRDEALAKQEQYEKERIQRQKIREENERKAMDREQWEEQLHREITREEALAKVRNTSMIELYKIQIELILKYKQEGANIDREIFAMREKLLELEGRENKAMIAELMDTLDRI